MVPSDFWGFWDATLPGGVAVNGSGVPTSWLDQSGNGRNHTLQASTAYTDGYLQNNGNYIFRTNGVLPDNGASPASADWAITQYWCYGTAWGSASAGWLSGSGTHPNVQGYGTLNLTINSVGAGFQFIPKTGFVAETFYPVTFFRADNRFGIRAHGLTSYSAQRTDWQYANQYWQLGSGRYRVKRSAVYRGTVDEDILDSIDRLMETGEDNPPDTGPVLSSPHLANHLDPSQLLSSPHLLGSFP